MIGALIGAAGSLLGGGAQIAANERAQNSKLLFDYYNLRKQQQARRDSQNFAEGVIDDQKLGGFDAQGNRTYFDELKGWTVDKSKRTKDLEGYFYGNELPEMRGQFDRKASRTKEFDLTADGLLSEFSNIVKRDPAALENMLYLANTRGASEAGREQTENSARIARQQGQTTDPNAGKFAEASMKSRGDARVDAKLKALGFADNQYNQNRGQVAGLLNQFNQLSNDKLTPTMDAVANADAANRNLSPMMQLLQQGNAQGFNSNMAPPPTINPDIKASNYGFIGQAGQQIGKGINDAAKAAMGAKQLSAGNQLIADSMAQSSQYSRPQDGVYSNFFAPWGSRAPHNNKTGGFG